MEKSGGEDGSVSVLRILLLDLRVGVYPKTTQYLGEEREGAHRGGRNEHPNQRQDDDQSQGGFFHLLSLCFEGLSGGGVGM